MRFLSLTALTVCLAAPALAQTNVPRQTADPRADPSVPASQVSDRLRADPTGIEARTVQTNEMRDARVIENPTLSTSDFDRLDRDMRTLGTTPDMTRYSQERDAIRRDYDALGTSATPQDRMDVMNRYQGLDANVRASRMTLSTRDAYFRMADDQIRMYDRDIEAARMGYTSATGNMRAERARDLIGLRRQRDTYRNAVYDVRGAGRTGFDAARRTAAPNLMRTDAEFRDARRESMMRGSTMSPGANGGMNN